MGNKATRSSVDVDPETDNKLNSSNRITISLTADAQQNSLELNGKPRYKKYTVFNDQKVEIMSGNELEPNMNSPLKTISLVDNTGKPQLKIVHRVGLSIVSICSVEGFILGETNVSISFGCCCVIKPKYTYHLKTGGEVYTMNGNISCCSPKLKVVGQDKVSIAAIKMGDTYTYQCHIKFLPGIYTENDRKTIVALCIGMLDSTYEKRLMSKKEEKPENIDKPKEANETEEKNDE